MNTQTDGHPVIFRIHTGTYVHMLTRPHACTLPMCLHVRTHSQPSLNIEVRCYKNIKLEVRNKVCHGHVYRQQTYMHAL